MDMRKILEAYAEIAGYDVINQLRQIAQPLHGLQILHVNSTKSGGGVAEILFKMVPLMQEIGIDTTWLTIEGDGLFYQCTKNFHNAIQGNQIEIPANQLQAYEQTNQAAAAKMKDILQSADVVFIHDPQPAALIEYLPERRGKWIWRCHIDASRPFRKVWKYLRNYVSLYDASIFSLSSFAQPLSHPVYLISPSIDPLHEKNIDLQPDEINEIYSRFNIDPERSMILQVSRFDRFKDPIGLIQAYQNVKKFVPSIQLVLAGSGASDDPEGESVLNEVKMVAENDANIKVLLLPGDAHRTINALQRAATIVLQKSIKEGFGLTVSEALWKKKPVIGGDTGGIRIQVINHHTGFLVNTPEGAALRIRYLLHNQQHREEMGEKGKEFVRNNFLITRQLREYLTLIFSILHDKKGRIIL
jgi:trehalose synthase